MNVIECNGLTKKFGRFTALKNMSFAIEENKITGLIGRNGAGKTTLLKIIAGYWHATAGEVRVFSHDPFNSLAVAGNTVLVDDNMMFPQTLSLQDILSFAATFYPNWDADLAQGLLEYFSLDPDQVHHALSKGMKSTFNVIVGICSRCPLTIFDEPTTGMDAGVRKDFYRALLKDFLAHPRTVILSSHLLNEIENLLEDVLLIDKGQKVLHMPVAELKEYALGLRGGGEAVEKLTEGMQVLYQETIAGNHMYRVVRNPRSESFLNSARLAGVELSAVSTTDLCLYLASGTRGGIDSVFKGK